MKGSTNTKTSPQSARKTLPVAKTDTRPLKSGKLNSNAIILQIAKAWKDRSRKDIQSWRVALAAMEHIDTPRFNRYFDLIDDLKTDGTLKTQILLRKSATLSIGFQIRNRKTGEVNEEASELFQQKWFYKYLGTELDSYLFGARIVEFLEFNGHNIRFAIVPPRNTVPVEKRIYPDLSKDNVFIQYDADEYKPWVIELNPDNPLGLINDIVPNLIWKRNVAQSWAEFCEKFGMPLVSATTNNNNAAHIDKVEQQLLALAEASVGVFPEGTTIKFDEANRTDAYNVYSKFIEQNTNEIAGVMVGSNTLSQNAANRSQTEVHERSLDYKISQADRRNISFTVNDDLIPLLRTQGYSYISEDDVFEWLEDEDDTPITELWNIVNGLMTNGYNVEQEWISTTFNIPIEGRTQRPVQTQDMNPEETPQQVRGKKKTWITPDYPQTCCPEHAVAVGGKINKLLAELSAQLAVGVYNKKNISGILGQLIAEEGLELLAGLRNGFKTFNPYTGPDMLALQMMEYNLFEFAAGKTEARLAAMTDLLVDQKTKQIRSFSEFRELAQKEVKNFNTNWLEAEYNLSIAVGQTSAQYVRFKAEEDSVTSFVRYQTAGDKKVRASHQALDGRIFNLKDKTAMDLWPPNGYGCRCEFLQHLGETGNRLTTGEQGKRLIQANDKRYKDSQFEVNRGDLKQVFTKKQFYHDTKDLPKKLNDMTFDKYDLKPWSSFKKDLNPIKLDSTITGDNVKELFKKAKGKNYMGFTDYLGRKMVMTESVFNDHTVGKYLNKEELRHQLFPHIKDILKKPDEVWLKDYSRKNEFQTMYVKYYQDMAIVVNTTLNNTMEGLEINTWYQMKGKEKDLRKGLLIKKGKDL